MPTTEQHRHHHATLVAILATHLKRLEPYQPGERRPTGAGITRPACSCGDWTDRGDGHTHAHHLADVLLEHGIHLPTPFGFLEHAQTGAHPDDAATLRATYGSCLECGAPRTTELTTRLDMVCTNQRDHAATEPTTPPAKYGRCPWCNRDVDTVELLEAGPYLTPCWHLVAVITPGTGLDGWRLERAAPPDHPARG